MIVDAFLFFNELDLLEIRLATLYDVVDCFVMVEGTETFSGKSKSLHYIANMQRFKRWADKIHYFPVRFPVMMNDAWEREKYTRAVLGSRVTTYFNKEDTVIVSDLDEIPKPEIVTQLCDGRYYGLNGILHYYWLNCRSTTWTEDYCRVGSVGRLAQTGGERFRRDQPDVSITNGCWHFSCLGGADAVARKLKSFAHTEFSGDYWTDLNRLEHVIHHGLDIVERSHMRFRFVELDRTYPLYVLENRNKFRHLIKELG